MSTLGLISTALGPLTVTPWPPQADAIDAVRWNYKHNKVAVKDEDGSLIEKFVDRTLVVLPTGMGKTLLSAFIGRRTIEKGGRILFLAPSTELVDQAARKFERLGITVGIEQARQNARQLFDPQAVIASIQTMRGKRLESWPQDYFTMIIVDECDLGFMGTYREIVKYFKDAKVLGITATIDRLDKKDLGTFYESIAYKMTIAQAMDAAAPGPYLCRALMDVCPLDMDLRDLRPGKGDFSEEDLEKRIKPHIHVLANLTQQKAGDRRGLIFMPGVASSQAIASALVSLGMKAEAVWGDDPDREGKIARIRSGETQVLASCSMIGRGFDVPEVSFVGLYRKTKSVSLLTQMVGRGLRRDRYKPNCLILDISCQTDGFDVARPIDLFATPEMDREALDMAHRMLLKDARLDMLKAIERSEETVKQQKEEAERRKKELEMKVQKEQIRCRSYTYDPLDAPIRPDSEWRAPSLFPDDEEFATSAQAAALKRFGIKDADRMPKSRASAMLGMAIGRAKAGLSSIRQINLLTILGMPEERARKLSYKEASEEITRLKRAKGMKVDPKYLKRA